LVGLHRLHGALIAQFHIRRPDLRIGIAIRRSDRARRFTLGQVTAREKNATGRQDQNRCTDPNFAITVSHVHTPQCSKNCAEDDRGTR
jgi:hypothetical protein